jgi:hypothetical protein
MEETDMEIFGIGSETYLLVNGLEVSSEIQLNESTILMPVTRELSLHTVSKILKKDADFAISILFAPRINSQLKITASDAKELAIKAWNSQWDLILLSAIFHCEAECSIQSTLPIEDIKDDTIIAITNYHIHGLNAGVYHLTDEDAQWISKYYVNASILMDNNQSFTNAVHSMASYRWHLMPGIQMAIIWTGIESLFEEVQSEVSFRLALYIAKMLEGDDKAKCKAAFEQTKKLYNIRSKIVHGGKIKKEDIDRCVSESAMLLNRLIKKCAVENKMPKSDELIF